MNDGGPRSVGDYYRAGSSSMAAAAVAGANMSGAESNASASPPVNTNSTSPEQRVSRPRARQRAQLSCDRCRRLKRKCDRQDPCSECLSIGTDCTFQRATETKEALQASRERRRIARRRSAWPDAPPQPQPPPAAVMSSASSSSLNQRSPTDAKTHHSSSSSSNVTPAESTSTAITTPPQPEDSNPTIVGSCGGLAASWTSLPLTPQISKPIPGAMQPDIAALLREPAFLERMVAIWFREVEWMHGVVDASPFQKALMADMNLVSDPSFMARYEGLLFAMLAMCALITPSDIEGILVSISSASARHGFFSGEAVGAAAHARAERWLASKAQSSHAADWSAEVFQTTLVHGMYVKYSGNWNLYREMTSRDMARMQRSGYMNLTEMVRNGIEEEEIACRYLIFWRFFVLDRISSLFDGVPYAVQARNADTWLFLPDEKYPMHIRALCRDSGAGDWSNAALQDVPPLPASLVHRLRNSLSSYSLTMVLLAALAGRCGDRLNTMSQVASLADNYTRAEQIAAETDDDLLSLEARVPLKMLTEHEHPMVTMTIARIRRDITTRLSRHIAKQHRAAPPLSGGEDAMVQTLNRRCLNTAKSLIRRGTSVCGFTPVRAIAMPFFTLFVAETMVELLTSVEECAAKATPRGALDSESRDDLKHALIGRNFLVLLARNSEMQLNMMVTQKACAHVSAVMRTCLTDRSDEVQKNVLDARRITDPDVMLQSIRAPPQPLSGKGTSPQRAEDVLEFLGSLTSLQRIFEMGGQSWSE